MAEFLVPRRKWLRERVDNGKIREVVGALEGFDQRCKIT